MKEIERKNLVDHLRRPYEVVYYDTGPERCELESHYRELKRLQIYELDYLIPEECSHNPNLPHPSFGKSRGGNWRVPVESFTEFTLKPPSEVPQRSCITYTEWSLEEYYIARRNGPGLDQVFMWPVWRFMGVGY